MGEQRSVLDWAREAQLSKPVRWGDVEYEILSRKPATSSRLPLWVLPLVAVGWIALAIVAVFGLGAPVVASVLVAVATGQDEETSSGLIGFATVFFVGASILQLSAIATWWSMDRRRNGAFLVGGVIAAVASGVTVYLAVSRDLATLLVLASAATTVLGVVVAVTMTVSKPEGGASSRKPPPRGPRRSGMRSRYEKTRQLVLDILVHRGQVKLDEADHIRLVQMPLGYWDALDDVDEVERRRILGLRLVGWRDFDATDRRPWPPRDTRP